jgi:tetratricopeptide (TPR) repeat protein
MHREPDNAEGYKKRAEISARMFDLKGAEDDYTRALSLNPNDADAYRKRAEIRIRKIQKKIMGVAEEEKKFDRKSPFSLSDMRRDIEAAKERDRLRTEQRDLEFKTAMDDLDAAQRIDPKNTKTYRMRAGFLSDRMEFKAAEDALNTALQIDDRDVEAYAQRAQIRECLRNHKGAVDDWTTIIGLKPESRYYQFRAYPREQQGDYNGAANDYKQALALEPYDAKLASHYGYLRKKAGYDPSKENWAQLVQIDPNKPSRSYADRAALRWQQGDLSGANEDYSQILQRNPNDFGAYSGRAFVREKQKDYKRTIEDLNQCLRLSPRGNDLHDRRAYARLMHGDYKGAMDDYNSLMESYKQLGLSTTEPCYRDAAQNCNFAEQMQKNNRGGLAYYAEYLRAHPHDAEAYKQRAEFRRLVRHEFKSDPEGAEADLDQAIRINPKDAEALKARADLRSLRGNVKGAEADYKAALAINPGDTGAEKNYKLCRGQDFDAMFDEYTLAIKRNPKDSEAFMNRAGIAPRVSAHKKIDYKGQIADITEALRINPKQPDAYRQRAEAYKQQGEFKKAIQDYTQSLNELTEYIKDYKGPHGPELRAVEMGLYMDRAQAYESLGDYKHALDDCNQSIGRAPLEFSLGPAMYRIELYKKMGNEKGINEAIHQASLLMNQLQLEGKWGGFP